MIESLATVLILNELVIASPILDSHLLGDLKGVFSRSHFTFSFIYIAFFIVKSFFMAWVAIQINHPHHLVINLDANNNNKSY